MSFWNSLRFKMPAIVLLGIIPPMLGAIFYASYRAELQLRHHAEEDIAYHAELLNNTVSWWDRMNIVSLKQLSDKTRILSQDIKRQELVLESLVTTNPNLYLATTVNLDGWNMARSDASDPKYYGDRPWFLQAKLGQGISYQTKISRSIGKPEVCMGKAIRNQGAEIVSVGMICSELSTLASQIGQLKFAQTGYAILVDETGQVLAHPNSALISGTILHNLNRYPPVKNILEDREGFFSFVNPQGIDWISYGISLENGWKIVLVQQKDEFYQNESRFQTLASVVALVAVLSASILTLLLANYLIWPIGHLTTAATAFAQGDLDRRVKVKRRDELGILASSFNQMASRLKTSFMELEHRVRQRTSELNTAKEAAEHANQIQDRFLARISHELRSPLNSIISYATILQTNPDSRDRDTQSQNNKGLSIIRNSGVHLLNLIEDILDFSQAKVSKIELHPTYLNWQSFLDEIIGMVELSAREKGLLLDYETVGNLTQGVWADQKRLQQVLINLLNNGIKFTEEGKVSLKVTVLKEIKAIDANNQYSQQQIRFEVIDTGIGISPEQLEKIFQPFQQVITSGQLSDGIGLGLSISKQIVSTMGSQLKVRSQLDVGSIFWFELNLPVLDSIPEKEEIRTVKSLPPDNLRSKILVVDDQEESYHLVANKLTPLGFKVFSTFNGKQALDLAPVIQPDLILLDLFMPVKSGFTLVRDFQKMPQLETIPIILISSSSYKSLKKANQTYDCQGFLTKPIDENELLTLMEEYGMFLECF